jgi:hypothetical protein
MSPATKPTPPALNHSSPHMASPAPKQAPKPSSSPAPKPSSPPPTASPVTKPPTQAPKPSSPPPTASPVQKPPSPPAAPKSSPVAPAPSQKPSPSLARSRPLCSSNHATGSGAVVVAASHAELLRALLPERRAGREQRRQVGVHLGPYLPRQAAQDGLP